MTNPAGELNGEAFRLDFDRRLTLNFVVRLSPLMPACLPTANSTTHSAFGFGRREARRRRTGKNGWHALLGMLRQAVFGRLAGYEDVNDAERLRHDPAMRWIVGGKAAHGCAASPSKWAASKRDGSRPKGIFRRLPISPANGLTRFMAAVR